jgi:predicted Zn-dependent protease
MSPHGSEVPEMLKRLIPATAALTLLAGCASLTPVDVVTRVIKGGAVAAGGFFLTDADEVALGQQTMAQVLASTPEFPNPTIRDYVASVGQRMVAQSERASLPFQFRVLQSNEVNAFAAPGGFVFVTLGALRLMTNEAQLAGVVGHEVGHVAKKHSMGAIRNTMIAQGIATGVLDGNNSQLIQLGANAASNLILKGFDRGAEMEADKLGATYAFKAGYDPRELGTFLDRLRQQSGDISPWLVATSDHPRTDDRLSAISGYIASEKMPLTGLKTGEAEYQAAVLDLLGSVPVTPSSPTPTPNPSQTPGIGGNP